MKIQNFQKTTFLNLIYKNAQNDQTQKQKIYDFCWTLYITHYQIVSTLFLNLIQQKTSRVIILKLSMFFINENYKVELKLQNQILLYYGIILIQQTKHSQQFQKEKYRFLLYQHQQITNRKILFFYHQRKRLSTFFMSQSNISLQSSSQNALEQALFLSQQKNLIIQKYIQKLTFQQNKIEQLMQEIQRLNWQNRQKQYNQDYTKKYLLKQLIKDGFVEQIFINPDTTKYSQQSLISNKSNQQSNFHRRYILKIIVKQDCQQVKLTQKMQLYKDEYQVQRQNFEANDHKQSINSKPQAISHLQQYCQEAMKQIVQIKIGFERDQKQRVTKLSQLQNEIKLRQEQLTKKNRKISQMQAKIHDAQDKLGQLSVELRNKEKQKQEQIKILDFLKQQQQTKYNSIIKQHETQLSSKLQLIKQQQTQLNQQSIIINQLSSKINELTTKGNQITNNFHKIKQELGQKQLIIDKKDLSIKQNLQSIKELTQQNNQKQLLMQQTAKRIQEGNTQILMLRQQLRLKNQELGLKQQEIQQQLIKMKQTSQKSQKENIKINEKLESLEQDNKQKQEWIRAYRQKQANNNNINQKQQQGEIQSQKQIINELQKRNNQLQKTINQLFQTIKELQTRLNEQVQMVNSQQTTIKQYEVSLQNLKEQADRVNEQPNNVNDEGLNGINKQLQTIKKQLKIQNQQLVKSVQQLNVDIEQLKQSNQQSLAKIQQLKLEISQIMQELQKTRYQNQILKVQVQPIKLELQQLILRNQQTNRKNQELTQISQTLNHDNLNIKKINLSFMDQKEKMEGEMKELKILNEELQKELKNWKKPIEIASEANNGQTKLTQQIKDKQTKQETKLKQPDKFKEIQCQTEPQLMFNKSLYQIQRDFIKTSKRELDQNQMQSKMSLPPPSLDILGFDFDNSHSSQAHNLSSISPSKGGQIYSNFSSSSFGKNQKHFQQMVTTNTNKFRNQENKHSSLQNINVPVINQNLSQKSKQELKNGNSQLPNFIPQMKTAKSKSKIASYSEKNIIIQEVNQDQQMHGSSQKKIKESQKKQINQKQDDLIPSRSLVTSSSSDQEYFNKYAERDPELGDSDHPSQTYKNSLKIPYQLSSGSIDKNYKINIKQFKKSTDQQQEKKTTAEKASELLQMKSPQIIMKNLIQKSFPIEKNPIKLSYQYLNVVDILNSQKNNGGSEYLSPSSTNQNIGVSGSLTNIMIQTQTNKEIPNTEPVTNQQNALQKTANGKQNSLLKQSQLLYLTPQTHKQKNSHIQNQEKKSSTKPINDSIQTMSKQSIRKGDFIELADSLDFSSLKKIENKSQQNNSGKKKHKIIYFRR